MNYAETTDAQILRLLEIRRGELRYDLGKCRARATEIAEELTDTERAIRDLEGGVNEDILRKHDG